MDWDTHCHTCHCLTCACDPETLKKEYERKEDNIREFIRELRDCIRYWDREEISSKEKMEGLIHTVLCMLDGQSNSWDGNIHALACDAEDFMLHEFLYENQNNE